MQHSEGSAVSSLQLMRPGDTVPSHTQPCKAEAPPCCARPLAPVSLCRWGQGSFDTSQHKNCFHPSHSHHLLGTVPIFPCDWRGMSGPIHIHVPPDLQLSPTSPFSSYLKQQRVTSPSQHSAFATKLVVK